MRYDALTESIRLLEAGVPDLPARLSRRIRYVPLAVERDEAVAATLFLRRGVNGEPWIDAHTLEQADGTWRILGGGGSNVGDEASRERLPLAELEAPFARLGSGGTRRTAHRMFPTAVRWVRWVELRAAAEVTLIEIEDREVHVPGHGFAVVVWAGAAPTVYAVSAEGAEIGELDLAIE